jgi:hypothetical protein
MKGSEQTYRWVLGLLRDLDFADAAGRMGLRLVSPDELEIDFLGRTYSVGRGEIALKSEKFPWKETGEDLDLNIKSVLGYYALSDACLEPVDEYCLLVSFSGAVFSGGGTSAGWAAGPLRKAFGADYGAFRDTALKLGMTEEAGQSNGRKWHYKLLPKMPVKLVYYEGDDEFPTDIKILYDKTAIKIYKFEPLAVLNGCFIHGLTLL